MAQEGSEMGIGRPVGRAWRWVTRTRLRRAIFFVLPCIFFVWTSRDGLFASNSTQPKQAESAPIEEALPKAVEDDSGQTDKEAIVRRVRPVLRPDDAGEGDEDAQLREDADDNAIADFFAAEVRKGKADVRARSPGEDVPAAPAIPAVGSGMIETQTYVTHAFFEDEANYEAIEVVAHRLRRNFKSLRPVITLAFESISDVARRRLEKAGTCVVVVDQLLSNLAGKGACVDDRERRRISAVWAFTLSEFSRVVYVDPFVAVMKPLDELFNCTVSEVPCAPHASVPGDTFDAHVMSIRPSALVARRLFSSLAKLVAASECSLEGVLNAFFPSWVRERTARLPALFFPANVWARNDDYAVRFLKTAAAIGYAPVHDNAGYKYGSNSRTLSKELATFKEKVPWYRMPPWMARCVHPGALSSTRLTVSGLFLGAKPGAGEEEELPLSTSTWLDTVAFRAVDLANVAYATYVTPTTNIQRLIALRASLTSAMPGIPFVALVLRQTDAVVIDVLQFAGFKVVKVSEIIPSAQSPVCATGKKADWSLLNAWSLVQYERVLYVSGDMLVVGNTSTVWNALGEPVAAANSADIPGGFDDGVMLVSPSQAVFTAMVTRAKAGVPTLYRCTAAEFLNVYFGKWSRYSIANRLPFSFNVPLSALHSSRAKWLCGRQPRMVRLGSTPSPKTGFCGQTVGHVVSSALATHAAAVRDRIAAVRDRQIRAAKDRIADVLTRHFAKKAVARALVNLPQYGGVADALLTTGVGSALTLADARWAFTCPDMDGGRTPCDPRTVDAGSDGEAVLVSLGFETGHASATLADIVENVQGVGELVVFAQPDDLDRLSHARRKALSMALNKRGLRISIYVPTNAAARSCGAQYLQADCRVCPDVAFMAPPSAARMHAAKHSDRVVFFTAALNDPDELRHVRRLANESGLTIDVIDWEHMGTLEHGGSGDVGAYYRARVRELGTVFAQAAAVVTDDVHALIAAYISGTVVVGIRNGATAAFLDAYGGEASDHSDGVFTALSPAEALEVATHLDWL